MRRNPQTADRHSESFAVLGVLSRVELSSREACAQELASLHGVSLFEVDDPQRLGILIERPTLADAESVLRLEVQSICGILGVWPVFAQAEEEEAPATNSCSSALPPGDRTTDR